MKRHSPSSPFLIFTVAAATLFQQAGTAWSQATPKVAPTAKIDVPAEVELGDMVVASATIDLTGRDDVRQSKFRWVVVEDGVAKPNFVTWPDGTKVFFAAGVKPKTYSIFLVVSHLSGTAGTVDGTPALANAEIIESPVASAVVKVGGALPPGPGPTPPPTPPAPKPDEPDGPSDTDVSLPDGKYKLAEFAYKQLTTLRVADKAKLKTLANGLAVNYEGVASKIVAVSTYRNMEEILSDLRDGNNKALADSGLDKSQVEPLSQAVGDKLYAMLQANEFDSFENFAVACRELATGFKGVAK